MFQILLIDDRYDDPEIMYNIQDFTCMDLSFESVTKVVDLYFSLKQIEAMERKEKD